MRLAVVLVQSRYHLFDVVYNATDSTVYRALAESLVEDGRFAQDGLPSAYVMPGYPIFLAALFLVSRGVTWISVAQCFVGGAMVAAVSGVGWTIARERGAWIAGAVSGVYPHFLFWTGYVLTETLYLAVLAVALLLAVRLVSRDDHPVRLAILTGVATGGAGLVRPTVLAIPMVAACVLAGSRRWRRIAILVVVGLLFVWTPWVVRNALVFDAFLPTSTEAGIVLWQGNSPGATGGSGGYVDVRDYKSLPLGEGATEISADRAHRESALRWMVENPRRVLALVPQKLWNMMRPTYAGASTLNVAVSVLSYSFLLGLGVLGLLRGRSTASGVLLLSVIAYHLLFHGLVTGMIRFRLPIELVLCMAAAYVVAPRNVPARQAGS